MDSVYYFIICIFVYSQASEAYVSFGSTVLSNRFNCTSAGNARLLIIEKKDTLHFWLVLQYYFFANKNVPLFEKNIPR